MLTNRLSRFICVLAASLWFANSLPAQERIVFGHILNEDTAHHRHLVIAGKEIARLTQDRYKLDIFPRGQIGTTDAQVIEGFATGTADMAYLSFGHLAKVYPRLAIGAGPFVFRDFTHWRAFAASDLYRELVTEMETQLGLVSFGLAYYGERHVTTKKPLNGLDDFKGLLIRVPNIPTMILTFRALGAKPVPLPFKETRGALADGIVDAQENPLPTIKTMRFHEVTPVVNLTAHILDAQIIVMHAKRWKTISAEDQTLIRQVLTEAAQGVTEDVRQEELALMEGLVAEGASLHQIDRLPLIEAMRPFHHSDYFPWGGELYERIQALK